MDPLTIVMLGVLGMLIFFMVRNSRKRRADMENLQQKMVPGAEVTMIEDASHMAFAEKRDEYIALMRDFIGRVE